MKNRILAVMPLVSVLLFLVAGLYWGEWVLGLTAFFLIPLSWILLTGKPLKRLSEIMPFVCLIVFLWLGFGLDLWHPGWMVFFLIPLVNIIVERRVNARKIVGIVVTGAYIGIGLATGQWHPTWIMFLLIPIINTIFFPQRHAYININKDMFKAKFKDIIIEHEKRKPQDEDEF
ncbi:MAG: hypothetical protein NUK62_07530 [Tenericutes bacterium]|nr:hypothetical protein [Mycoplasmatota bacterium]